MNRRSTLLTALVLLLASSVVNAQNLLDNPHFVDDLASWNDLGVGQTPEWSPETASGLSGSALLTNNSSSAGVSQVILGQCQEVVPDTEYLLSTRYLIPSQSNSGWVAISTSWHQDTLCEGGVSAAVGSNIASVVGSWTSLSRTFTPIGVTHSVHFRFMVNKTEAGGTFFAHFDDSVLIASSIFEDGFETGTTALWSATSP